jgi:hypothetical protein
MILADGEQNWKTGVRVQEEQAIPGGCVARHGWPWRGHPRGQRRRPASSGKLTLR